MFGLFRKKTNQSKEHELATKKQLASQSEQLMNSKRNIRDRIGAKERRTWIRRQQHDRRQMIRFEFKDDRRSGRDRRRENNASWSKDSNVDKY